MTDHERNMEHYNYDAWGEHTDTANLPPTENNIRYGGARVECFAKSVTSTDAIYLCGERHYWPAYGRFLQRDRMGYEKLPAPSSPLGANPYIYAENNPVMKKDLSGLQPAGYYRGARMGSRFFYIGTEMPPESQMYDCCGNMRYNSLSAQEVAMSPVYNTKLGGSAQFSWWQKRAGWSSDLCQAKPGEGQPNDTCKAITAATPDLLCTYLEQCKGLSCPPWKGGECPDGRKNTNPPYPEDPRQALLLNPDISTITAPCSPMFSSEGFPTGKWTISQNFGPHNWQDPFWGQLYDEIGPESFTQLVNEVIPWAEETYYAKFAQRSAPGWFSYRCADFNTAFDRGYSGAMQNFNDPAFKGRKYDLRGWTMRFRHSSVHVPSLAMGGVLAIMWPKGWMVPVHRWAEICPPGHLDIALKLDPPGSNAQPVLFGLSGGYVTHDVIFWQQWAEDLGSR